MQSQLHANKELCGAPCAFQNMQFGNKTLDLSCPLVMGILNITPDSFSDGGELFDGSKPMLASVIDRAAAMVEAGAALLDIGGESTRPGAAAVTELQELERVIPVVEALHSRFDVVLSVDTSNARVIQQASASGAGLINDVRSLSQPGALDAAARSGLAVCLMHMQGTPGTMQQAPAYSDVVVEVRSFLQSRIQQCVDAGIPVGRLLIDPGFGFGKSLQHNLTLMANLETLNALGVPMLVGISRKRMLGAVTGKPEKQREAAGIAGSLLAIQKGARIIRTHDVAGMVDAIKMWVAVQSAQQ